MRTIPSRRVAESVSFMHPDKICDQISDLILDAYLTQDPKSRVAIETIGGHGRIILVGEVTSRAVVRCTSVVRSWYKKLTGQPIHVESFISQQSPQISRGVDTGGAGDQGVMIGYACRENDQYIPHEMFLARKLLRGFEVDAKSQVVIENKKVTSVVLSVQGEKPESLQEHVIHCGLEVSRKNIFANFTGAFDMGGFDADSGCTGRKIVVDAYGPRVPVGGGAFSGKDATKVDRSAAYMARWVALKLLKKYGANEVLVTLGYVIGKAEPLIKSALIDGREMTFHFDCRPQAIIERFELLKPQYLDLARNGHFGRLGEVSWEKV